MITFIWDCDCMHLDDMITFMWDCDCMHLDNNIYVRLLPVMLMHWLNAYVCNTKVCHILFCFRFSLRQLGVAKIFLGQFLGGGEVSKHLELNLVDGNQRPCQVGTASSQACKIQYLFCNLITSSLCREQKALGTDKHLVVQMMRGYKWSLSCPVQVYSTLSHFLRNSSSMFTNIKWRRIKGA